MIRILRKTDYKIPITLTILLTPIIITPNHIMNLPTNITIQTRGMDTVKPSKKNRSMYQLHCMDQ